MSVQDVDPDEMRNMARGWKKTVAEALTKADKQAEIMDSKNRLKEAANKMPSGVLVNGGRLKTRKEVEAELSEDTASGGVLAWDRSPKHVGDCMCDEKGSDPDCFREPKSTKHTPTPVELLQIAVDLALLPDEMRRMDALAGYSYAKHCKDPVAAAESDLLGRALALLRETLPFMPTLDAGPVRFSEQAQVSGRLAALLAETKEGPDVD